MVVDRMLEPGARPSDAEWLDDPVARPAPGSVIVGYDGSPGACVALDWARRWTDERALVAACSGGRSRAHVAARNSAADDLVNWSRDAFLLVVGSRGRRRWVNAALGSTGARCAHRSDVPVAIVPVGTDPHREIRRVAVGVDGSDNSVEALRWALRSVPPAAIVDIWFTWLTQTLAESLDAEEVARVGDATREFLDTVVDGVISEEPPTARPIQRHLAIGDPADALHASAPDLIVTGARSHTGWASLAMRSPADTLLGEKQAVVVVVPAGG